MDINECMNKHISQVDKQLMMSESTGKSLVEWLDSLIEAFSEDGAVPYLITTKERFRASPLASTIIWMEEAGLLPKEVLGLMQNKLLFLNNTNQPDDPKVGEPKKQTGDEHGWSLAEGVSTWSTSLAIIALTQNTSKPLQEGDIYNNAVLWLVKQQDITSKGWAYQNHRNCDVNIITTSLAIQALAKAYYENSEFFEPDDQRDILNAITSGFDYLEKSCVTKKKYTYWCFNNEPSCTATTWALLATKGLCNIDSVNSKAEEFYNKNIKSCLNYILCSMPSKESHWLDEKIVCEAGAKYNAQKNYYSFKAALLMQLFELGLSPYHPKVVKQMRWLIQNPDEWKITYYDQTEICTFTYAMVVSTMVSWHYHVGNVFAQQLLRTPRNKHDKIENIIYGFDPINMHPVQLICKNRFIYYIILLILIPSLIFLGRPLLQLIANIFNYIEIQWNLIADSVKVTLVVTIIIAIFASLWKRIVCFIKKVKIW